MVVLEVDRDSLCRGSWYSVNGGGYIPSNVGPAQ